MEVCPEPYAPAAPRKLLLKVGEGPKIAEIFLTVNPSEAYEVESLQVLFCSKGTAWRFEEGCEIF